MRSPLATASTATFEALGLLLPDAEPSAEQLAAPLARGVRVTFAGPFAGALTVRVSDDVATTLAANMLGVDAIAGEDRLVRDALGEVANVICGNLLPELAGRAAVFHLGAPEPVPASAAGADRPSLAVTLGVDAGRAEVALHVDPVAADPAGAGVALSHGSSS
jgi:CheY-specific phosphatase CheX